MTTQSPDATELDLAIVERALNAASGLSLGTDWNNGTMAKKHGYRAQLLDALPAALDAMNRLQERAALPSNATTNASLVEALEAMREPTDAMIDAAADTPGMKAVNAVMGMHQARGYGFSAGAFDQGSPLHQAWRAMIDTALATLRASNEGDGK